MGGGLQRQLLTVGILPELSSRQGVYPARGLIRLEGCVTQHNVLYRPARQAGREDGDSPSYSVPLQERR